MFKDETEYAKTNLCIATVVQSLKCNSRIKNPCPSLLISRKYPGYKNEPIQVPHL